MGTQIEITVGPDGNATIHVASILHDLHEDYRYFAAEAKRIGPNGDALAYKRFARAAIISFFNYFEGVLNHWIAIISPQTDLGKVTIGQKLEMVREKIRNDSRRHARAEFGKQRLDLTPSKTLRNRISHLKLGDNDLDITEELLGGRFLHDAKHLESWLRTASHFLDLECHPHVDRIANPYIEALGSVRE